MISTLTAVPISMIRTSFSPSSVRSATVAIGPLRWTVRLVPATVCLTIAATRLNAACVSGDAASPANVMGRFQALLSLLANSSFISGTARKS
ncbi:Uncharacterised protein [Mycobacterium tuberculosis]|uniref:Uncharacterized protein n=1 Tax=Mycobacterium tuberculosis TaxID=1773 RepID=A0A654U523_MYCTX|nr:Uncharacterised protein [Mycobacterium tuberculosis]CFR99310.1 Uncharacterised protein [Mycobacterium tuberculosis]CFS43237.1 Uncharacterised protein [Mycobacterium tuberculosis]CKM70757.1 Uncharacterised protein [Mycobacterium tuberculosis]CKP10953.1 Uncharacterised protein [Mycobacterium tuberculosis]